MFYKRILLLYYDINWFTPKEPGKLGIYDGVIRVPLTVCTLRFRSELFLEDHKLDVDVNPKRNSTVPSTLSYSLPVLEEMMGLKLYTNYQLPNVTEIIKSPMVLFNGPLRLNIFLLKSDVKVNKYVIEYKWLTNRVSEQRVFAFRKEN